MILFRRTPANNPAPTGATPAPATGIRRNLVAAAGAFTIAALIFIAIYIFFSV